MGFVCFPDEMMMMMSPPSGQENIFLDGEYKLQISASDGGRGRGQTAGDILCGRKLFSRDTNLHQPALTPTQGGQGWGSINLIGTGIISGYHSLKC